jgi:glycine/D-amino acid oxidase-like deaminating enzyme
MFLHYSRTTPDGRILMGSGSGPMGFGRRCRDSLTRDGASIDRARNGLRELFPQLPDIPIEHAWGGPIDVSSDHLPFFGCADGRGIYFGAGYSGHGVNATWIGGQVLASLALRANDEWTSSPFVSRQVPALPPEPFRYLGGRLIQKSILACEEAEEKGQRGSRLSRLIAALPGKLGLRIGTR